MVEIVPCVSEYWEFVRLLRTDPRTSPGFASQKPISEEEQIAYMRTWAHRHVVALWDGQPSGYSGSIEGDIRVCVHPDFQKRGIGKALIQAVLVRWPDSVAKVKVTNGPSQALFRSCGFKPVWVTYERERCPTGT